MIKEKVKFNNNKKCLKNWKKYSKSLKRIVYIIKIKETINKIYDYCLNNHYDKLFKFQANELR